MLHRKDNKKKRGFTLIELIVVVAIVGAILGLVTTRLDFLSPRSRLSAGARAIASSVILAYNRAVVLGKPVLIQHYLAKGYHRLVMPPTEAGQQPQPLSPMDLPKGVHYDALFTASGRKYAPETDAIVEISISPLGTIVGHVIHLSNEKGAKLTLEVNPITGLVQIKEGHRPLEFIEKS
jgi:prepilin-type N-terminal cleavage/methylation domain-containing protein